MGDIRIRNIKMNVKSIINKSLIYLVIISSILLYYSRFDIISENGFVALYNIRFIILGAAALCENKVIIILMVALYILMELALLFLLIPIKRIYKVKGVLNYIIRMLCVPEIVIGILFVFSSGIGGLCSMLMSIILFGCLSVEYKHNRNNKKNEYISINYADIENVTR